MQTKEDAARILAAFERPFAYLENAFLKITLFAKNLRYEFPKLLDLWSRIVSTKVSQLHPVRYSVG